MRIKQPSDVRCNYPRTTESAQNDALNSQPQTDGASQAGRGSCLIFLKPLTCSARRTLKAARGFQTYSDTMLGARQLKD
ncbi:hypothetical protein ANANG_G00250210 [Anguilla anguilla]|uniref:Uncharacterized protein n=1 Tax=Anguilla anguilla TaxID=7936 RepID=A0A9D3RQG9_ANGAN|nr:hypothetical protein ANANG_G00250210 [Anguilla anguilla]